MIELLATLTLFAIVVSVGVPLLNILLDAYWTAKVVAPASSEGTLAMERMVRETRLANRSSLQLANGSLAFDSPEGRVQLHQTRSGDAGIYLVKNGEEQPLARAVATNSLSFSLLTPQLLAISFTLSTPLADGTTVQNPLSTAVYLPP
ncbi:MAG: hypothetical protein H7835_06415 [Magnetococcus sp. XQGC-1]